MTGSGPEVSRRSLLGAVGIGAAGLVVGGVAGATAASASDSLHEEASGIVPFYDGHQAGITTPPQDRVEIAAFDVTAPDRQSLIEMLQQWTSAASNMTAGQQAVAGGAVDGPPDAPPTDTGEALGLPASELTLTFGVGATLFRDATGKDRFGIANKRPANLIDMPAFPKDDLDPLLCGGDLVVQACANDAQVAFHAIRNLAREAHGSAVIRWVTQGFGRTAATSAPGQTTRNLFGFKDGTLTITDKEAKAQDDFVWAEASDGTPWMAGGTYLVARRIQQVIETWDRTSLEDQQKVIGRFKGSGAPLSGGTEFSPLDLTKTGPDGQPLIPTDAHVAVVSPEKHGGTRLLRRGYSFTDGVDDTGHLNAGLMFLAFVRNPATQFVPIQMSMSSSDHMNEYIKTHGSSLYAIPPGLTKPGQYWGQQIFA